MSTRARVLLVGLLCALFLGLAVWLGFLFLQPSKQGIVFPMVEVSFHLSGEIHEPFAKELWGWIENFEGDGMWVPAYYEGGDEWKLRYSPRAKGKYRVKIYLEQEGVRSTQSVTGLQPEVFTVAGKAFGDGLVRINPENRRTFSREDGAPYYPVGLNVGWDLADGDVVAFLERLAAAEGNWSRIWMSHWDGKNLDWLQGKKLPLGELDPTVAAKWDRIVAAADRLQIPFQMVLQHHGQYSSGVDSDWKENPWNKTNGGFLERAEDFFTDARAKTLTKRKYRYIVARYGYSPSIMAWELFNEVEYTDAGKKAEGRAAIQEWHEEMAAYLRSIDSYQHLITTSALPLRDAVWNVADYYQVHSYPPDPLTGSGGFSVAPSALARPVFYSEIGSAGDNGQTAGDGGKAMRDVLWGGIFAGAGATAQYWAWDQVDREKLYPLLTAMAKFSRLAGLGQGFWRPLHASVSTDGKADLVFGPGRRWDSVVDPQLVLATDGSGRPAGVGFSSTLRPRRGSGEKAGTDTVTFEVNVVQPTRWEITVSEVSKVGAKVEMMADDKLLATHVWEPGAAPHRAEELPFVLGVDLPAGARRLKIRSSGADYLQISSIRLQAYVPELGLEAMANDQNAVLWIYRMAGLTETSLRNGSETFSRGTIQATGLRDGKYQALWWDTSRALIIRTENCVVVGGHISLDTPPIYSDLALLLSRKDRAFGGKGVDKDTFQ